MIGQQQSTTLNPQDYDSLGETAVLKRTQRGELVIQVEYAEARCWSLGEVARLDDTSGRLFRIDRKGQPFPVHGDVAAYARRFNISKAAARVEMQGVYLYVTELTPDPVAGPACALCGAATDAVTALTSARGEVCPDCYKRAEA